MAGVITPISSSCKRVALCRPTISSPRRIRAVDDAHEGDHAAVLVVDGVEHERARRARRVARRRRDALADGVEHGADADAGLGGDAQHVVGLVAEEVGDLRGGPSGSAAGRSILLRTGTISRSLSIARCALARVCASTPCAASTTRMRALAGGQRARDLVAEVDVPGRVDEVQLVGLALVRPEHAHGLRLDRDPALALEIHGVEHLVAHLALGHRAGDLQDAVGQRRLAVVDVRDDREVADAGLRPRAASWHATAYRRPRRADGVATRPARAPAPGCA